MTGAAALSMAITAHVELGDKCRGESTSGGLTACEVLEDRGACRGECLGSVDAL
jgi:hypothetical protein